MLTGLSYDEVAGLVSWGDRKVHYMTWADICTVLEILGRRIAKPTEVSSWDDVSGVAIVHVEPDHFILYDSEEGLFYDPAAPRGPAQITSLVPLSYLRVSEAGVQQIAAPLSRQSGSADRIGAPRYTDPT